MRGAIRHGQLDPGSEVHDDHCRNIRQRIAVAGNKSARCKLAIEPLKELAAKSQTISDTPGDEPIHFGPEDVTDILNNTIDYLLNELAEKE